MKTPQFKLPDKTTNKVWWKNPENPQGTFRKPKNTKEILGNPEEP